MKPKLLAMCFTVACSVVLLNAQDPSQSRTTTQSETRTTTQERHETSSTETGTSKMTLTGCLQTGTAPNTYVLNNVTVSHETTGMGKQPSEMPKAETSYALTAGSSVNLKDHVGHKVEVVGKAGKEKATTGSTSESTMTNFKVDSVKHISETCP